MKNMNLVVICADTFRADIIGKNKKLSFVKTPYLDTLAQESVVFDKCFGEGEPTIPVRRCLFTGIRSFPWRFETPNEGLLLNGCTIWGTVLVWLQIPIICSSPQ